MQREGSNSPNELGEAAQAWPAVREHAPERRAPARLSAPRLSVAYILLWIAGAAVVMAAVRRLNPADPGALGLLLVSSYAALCGAAWTGIVILITRAVRGAMWPVEAGHWLLTAQGVRMALELVIMLWLPEAFKEPQTVLDAAMCCCLVMPLLSRSLHALWKGFFALSCVLSAWPLAIVALASWFWAPHWLAVSAAWVEQNETGLIAIAVIPFALADWRGWRQRTWLHWTGLGFCLLSALVAIIWRFGR